MFRRDTARAGRATALPSGGRLINLSTRAQAGPGVNLIPGFVVAGSVAKTFLIRAVGPTLAAFEVPGPLADPTLELHTTIAGQDAIVAQNDNWGDESSQAAALATAAAATGAFPLPAGSLDAALLAKRKRHATRKSFADEQFNSLDTVSHVEFPKAR